MRSWDPTGFGTITSETYYFYDDRRKLASITTDAGFTSDIDFERELIATSVDGVAQLQIGEGDDTRHLTIHMRNRGAESVSFSSGYLDPMVEPIAAGLGHLYMNYTLNGWILSALADEFPEAPELLADALESEPVKVLEDVVVAKGFTAAIRALGRGALAGAEGTLATRTSRAVMEADELVVVYGGVDPKSEKAAATVLASGAVAAVPDVAAAASKGGFPKDFPTKATNNWSANYASEGEARALARQKIGTNPVEVEPGKWRSADGKWQYRAKPGDVSDNHIHLEELNPETGEVLQNVHLRWE